MVKAVFFYCILFIGIILASCSNIEVKEKAVEIPKHLWNKNTKAVIYFDIKDSAMYNVYCIVRHTKKFAYTNLILDLDIQDTAKKSLQKQSLNLPLVKQDGNWSGKNMDDLYDHRIKIDKPILLNKGQYRFVMQHAMKENPLPYILNVGIEIRKI